MYNIFRKFKATRPRRGTSLMELTVVLAVMGTLTTTVAVTFSGVRENSADAAAMQDLQNFGKQVALNGQYTGDPGSRLVSGPVVSAEDDTLIPESFTGCKTSGSTYDAVQRSRSEFEVPGAGSNLTFTSGPATRSEATDSAAASSTWSFCIATVNGEELLGLATVSRTDNCVFAKGGIDRQFTTWSYGADLGGNCTGAVALFLTAGSTAGADSAIGYIDVSLAGAPEAVTLLSAIGGTRSMTLSWQPSVSTDTVRYRVYKCDNECAEQDIVSTSNLVAWPTGVSALATSIQIDGLADGKNYRFAVVPVDGTGYIGSRLATNLVPTKPQAPVCPSVKTLDGSVTVNFSQFPQDHVVSSVTAFLSGPDGVVNFTSSSLASGIVSATGLTNGEVYSMYAVGSNASGDSVHGCVRTVVALALPAQPLWKSPAAVVGDDSITLSWNAVTSTTSSPVDGYTLLKLNPSSGVYELYELLSASTTSKEITGLTGGVAQSFQISAYNDNANGLRSEAVTATPIAAPLSPVSVSTGRSDLGGYINWSVTSSAARPVEGFYAYLDGTRIATIVYDAATGTYTQTFNQSTSGIAIVSGTTYSATVTSYNTRNGVKVESAPLTFSFVAVAAPLQVTGVAVNPLSTSDSQLKVSWSLLAPSAARPVDQYAVMKLNPSSGVWEIMAFTSSSTNESVSTGLTSGVSYSYRVFARGPVVDGPVSVTVSGIPIATPNAAAITASGRGDRLVSINFETTSTAAKPVVSIEVTRDGTVVDVLPASATTHTFTGLTPGTSYTFGVRPTNAVGAPALTTVDVVAVTAPAAVTGLVSVPTLESATALRLTWNAVPSTSAGRVDGYSIESINPLSGVYEVAALSGVSSNPTHLLSGLTSGVPRTVRVQAYGNELTTLSGGYSESVTATPIGAPVVPVISSLTRRDSGFRMSYAAAASAANPVTKVEVLFNNSPAASNTGQSSTAQWSFTDVSLDATPGTTYSIKVTACLSLTSPWTRLRERPTA